MVNPTSSLRSAEGAASSAKVDGSQRAGASPVYEIIRGEILRGVHAPGSRLVEAQLAQRYGVSRTPVRAALSRLEGDGLVETEHNRGAFVSRWTDADFEEVYALRIRLEPYASRLAAGHVAPAEADRLDTIAARMIELANATSDGWSDKCSSLNAELHSSILLASRSPRLISIVTALTEQPMIRRAIGVFPTAALRRNFEQHHQIIEAIRQGDGEWAESLMAAHILAARQALRATRDGLHDAADHLPSASGSKLHGVFLDT